MNAPVVAALYVPSTRANQPGGETIGGITRVDGALNERHTPKSDATTKNGQVAVGLLAAYSARTGAR